MKLDPNPFQVLFLFGHKLYLWKLLLQFWPYEVIKDISVKRQTELFQLLLLDPHVIYVRVNTALKRTESANFALKNYLLP